MRVKNIVMGALIGCSGLLAGCANKGGRTVERFAKPKVEQLTFAQRDSILKAEMDSFRRNKPDPQKASVAQMQDYLNKMNELMVKRLKLAQEKRSAQQHKVNNK